MFIYLYKYIYIYHIMSLAGQGKFEKFQEYNFLLIILNLGITSVEKMHQKNKKHEIGKCI